MGSEPVAWAFRGGASHSPPRLPPLPLLVAMLMRGLSIPSARFFSERYPDSRTRTGTITRPTPICNGNAGLLRQRELPHQTDERLQTPMICGAQAGRIGFAVARRR
jgi:hypothetical protein